MKFWLSTEQNMTAGLDIMQPTNFRIKISGI